VKGKSEDINVIRITLRDLFPSSRKRGGINSLRNDGAGQGGNGQKQGVKRQVFLSRQNDRVLLDLAESSRVSTILQSQGVVQQLLLGHRAQPQARH
jgi:hypothetical protein